MGENDIHIQSLRDETLVKEEGALSRCVYCDKIRIGNADVCLHCLRKSRQQAGMIFLFVLFLVAFAFLAAVLTTSQKSDIPPPRHVLPAGLSDNLQRLRESEVPTPVLSWHAQFLEDSCALCPECCSSVVPDALGPLDED